jgi:hypothetical protein
VACENRDVAQCIEGCRVREGCFGGSVSCDTLTNRAEVCVQAVGCRYLGTCEGAEGCSGLDFDEECPFTAGCVQVRRCDGEGFTCESLEDSQCELYSQCELGSHCVGNARSCSDVGSTSSCLDVPGCIPADTAPTVLD